MEKKYFILRTDSQIDNAIDLIEKLPVHADKPLYIVKIEPFEEQRTKKQNRMIWLLATYFATHTQFFDINLGKEGWYAAFAKAFLDPVESIDIKTGEITYMPRSMSQLTKKDFSYVIDKIYEYAMDKDFPVPHADDLLEMNR